MTSKPLSFDQAASENHAAFQMELESLRAMATGPRVCGYTFAIIREDGSVARGGGSVEGFVGGLIALAMSQVRRHEQDLERHLREGEARAQRAEKERAQ